MLMLKPPIADSLRFYATPRMLRWLLVLLFAVLIPTVGASLAREFLFPPPAAPAVGPLPPLDFTTDGSRYSPPIYVLFGELPDPAPNQKHAPCTEDVGEKEMKGACWLAIKKGPPCPKGKAFEDNGVCWLPVAYAARTPTSGGGAPVNIADPP